jgi:hypothetical protein
MEVLEEELLVEDLAQRDMIWKSILELRQESKGYHEWIVEFETSLAIHRRAEMHT